MSAVVESSRFDADATSQGRSLARAKWVAVTVVLGLFAFLTSVNGPLGPAVFGWHPAASVTQPVGIQLPLFMLLGLMEALAFGFGVAFLLFGYPWVRAAGPAPTPLARLAHLSIAWVLINWWSHDSFHIANGLDLGGLLTIEYAYHVTLMTAGVIAAAWFVTVLREQRLGTPAPRGRAAGQ
jgi:hypothetical protein